MYCEVMNRATFRARRINLLRTKQKKIENITTLVTNQIQMGEKRKTRIIKPPPRTIQRHVKYEVPTAKLYT